MTTILLLLLFIYFWLTQDCPNTTGCSCIRHPGWIEKWPCHFVDGRGKPKWETSTADIQVESSSGLPFHFTRYSSYCLFVVLPPTRLSRISSISSFLEVGIGHGSSIKSSSAPSSWYYVKSLMLKIGEMWIPSGNSTSYAFPESCFFRIL